MDKSGLEQRSSDSVGVCVGLSCLGKTYSLLHSMFIYETCHIGRLFMVESLIPCRRALKSQECRFHRVLHLPLYHKLKHECQRKKCGDRKKDFGIEGGGWFIKFDI